MLWLWLWLWLIRSDTLSLISPCLLENDDFPTLYFPSKCLWDLFPDSLVLRSTFSRYYACHLIRIIDFKLASWMSWQHDLSSRVNKYQRIKYRHILNKVGPRSKMVTWTGSKCLLVKKVVLGLFRSVQKYKSSWDWLEVYF